MGEISLYSQEDLGRIITFKVGIGSSLAEANVAMALAKEKESDSIKGYSIASYLGDHLSDDFSLFDKQVQDYSFLKNILESLPRNQDALNRLDNFCYDPVTGALNKLGLVVALKHLESLEDTHLGHSYLLFDGNNMHDWNRSESPEWVDRRLADAGRALKCSARNSGVGLASLASLVNTHIGEEKRSEGGHNDLIACGGSSVSRVNGSVGDEFLAVLPGVPSLNVAEYVARRFLNSMYEAQLKSINDE